MRSVTCISDDIWKYLVLKHTHIKYCQAFCETMSFGGFFPATGCQVPALGDEGPALHIAEDQGDGQGKGTTGSTNTFPSIQNNEMIQTKD